MKIAFKGGTPARDIFIPYGKQYIDEHDIEAVTKVLKSPYLTTGPKVEEFEKKLCGITGAKYAIALSSGTSALHAACHAAGIQQGDEVITTPMTFAASANCILYCGGTPVFADIDAGTWNIKPEEIEKNVTSKTKAVIAVDFTGQAVQLDEIRDICKRYNLILIEDAAHAIGTKYNGIPVGNISDLTTFSFHPVKTITCGEGGAVLTNNEEYYKKIMLFRSHAITREIDEISQHPFNGYNEQIGLGYNYRMTDMQAALGISQLDKLWIFSNRRSEIVKKYNEAFSEIPQLTIQQEIQESDTTRHLYIIRIKSSLLKVNRNEIYKALNAENIGLQVHYIPVYYHPYYQSLGYNKGICPIAEKLYEEIITIPLYFSLTDDDVQDVIKGIKKVINYYKC
ncbi:UDP-4-amino-4,6-dideoxy-N-acetyl-beta-L-altrosamine transaminase [Acetobacterium bakii]|uniref:Aminotransferase DegT n=1 Tax=Acetobacterium bakii TaxID=52689 RepID=A0A0L6U2S7_9FIRM|nr:UDP-4-amino-4,6-dideoxy-N-acetyl-beta-L-altrosamine transaminase [Acetobacterium bakii]KNZ42657.1 aminotransferase DegT [Acetobacterium bakii]